MCPPSRGRDLDVHADDPVVCVPHAGGGSAGESPIRFYVLRHTHGSIVAAATRDIRTVQRRIRHASAAFTLETYIHLLDDRAGVDAVADGRGGRSKRRTRG